MQPQSRMPTRWPSKVNHHPGRRFVNWWEAEIATESKKTDRANAKKQINEELMEDNEGKYLS